MDEPKTITITIDAEGVNCDSKLAPAEIVFWLEAMKTVIISELMGEPESE